MLEACSSGTKATILHQKLQVQHQKTELQQKKASSVDPFLIRQFLLQLGVCRRTNTRTLDATSDTLARPVFDGN